jgi:hypothetical protein
VSGEWIEDWLTCRIDEMRQRGLVPSDFIDEHEKGLRDQVLLGAVKSSAFVPVSTGLLADAPGLPGKLFRYPWHVRLRSWAARNRHRIACRAYRAIAGPWTQDYYGE